jgi:hypothetical protein
MPKGPKDWRPTSKRGSELEAALAALLEFVTSGRRYETRNPYSLPEVKEAIRLLDLDDYKGIYGPYSP